MFLNTDNILLLLTTRCKYVLQTVLKLLGGKDEEIIPKIESNSLVSGPANKMLIEWSQGSESEGCKGERALGVLSPYFLGRNKYTRFQKQ